MTENASLPETSSDAEMVLNSLSEARSAGSWMPWAGFAVSLGWWGAGLGAAFALAGPSKLFDLPLSLLAAGALAILLPGFLILMGSFMARESTRSARANAVVLESTARLLSPSREVAGDAEMFAAQLRNSAASVDKAMGHALSALKAMAGELGDERMRVESVAYASADNARDLSQRLQEERAALEVLARDIKTQTEAMTEAIPRQAKMMVEAAQTAGVEIAKADQGLEDRLAMMDTAGQQLGEKLIRLDAMAQEGAERTQALTYAIARVEEKLEQSKKTVEQAVRAGEMAAAAAGTSGDALKDAVSHALDGARHANNEIQASTRAASEEAARALAGLRETGEQAAIAVRAAGNAARAETDIVERRLTQMSGALGKVAGALPSHTQAAPQQPVQPVPPPPTPKRRKSDFEPAPTPTPAAPPQTYANGHSNGHAQPQQMQPAQPVQPAVTPPPAQTVPADDELFDTGAAPRPQDPPMGIADHRRDMETVQRPDPGLRTRLPDAPAQPNSNETQIPASGDTAWSDILADVDRAAPAPQDIDPEEAVQILLERLQQSGIELAKTFRPKDKKRVAQAAKRSENDRRAATRSVARGEVDRVSGRLRGNADMMMMAEQFLHNEEDIALSYLEKTARSGKNASPRLSAYLLIDAAVHD